MKERRQSARYSSDGDDSAALPLSASVQVLDISLTGVLLESLYPVQVGTRGRLRLKLGDTPVVAEVEVLRVTARADKAYRVGAAFVNLSTEQQQIIERFTSH